MFLSGLQIGYNICSALQIKKKSIRFYLEEDARIRVIVDSESYFLDILNQQFNFKAKITLLLNLTQNM